MKPRLPVVAIFALICTLCLVSACGPGNAQTPFKPGTPPTVEIPSSGKTYSSGRTDANTIWVLNKKDLSPEEFTLHTNNIGSIIAASYSTDGTFREDQAWHGINLYFTITDAKKYAKK